MPSHTGWDDLSKALSTVSQSSGKYRFWWRDDDAVEVTDALKQLGDCAGDAPLCIAVIPEGAQETLNSFVSENPGVSVLQHGIAHRNRALPIEKKSEFPAHRAFEAMTETMEELEHWRETLEAMFGDRFLPIFVPPWNRIDDGFFSTLSIVGFKALSTYRRSREGMPQTLQLIDTHIDVIDWRNGRKFKGEGAVLSEITSMLKSGEPLGLLTHHLVHDQDCWAFLDTFRQFIDAHPNAEWVHPLSLGQPS